MKYNQLPNQLIPDSQKGEEFIKENLLSIKNFGMSDASSKQRDIECWYMYHNIWNEEEFEYLTKVPSGTQGGADYYLPAKVRHIPIQRSKLNVLIGQQKHRPYQFSTTVAYDDCSTERQVKALHDYFGQVGNVLSQRISNYQQQIISIEQQKQEIQQLLQQQPQTPEKQQQLMQLQQSVPAIENQLNTIKEYINRETLLTEDDRKEMFRLYNYNKEDFLNDIIQKVSYKVRADLLVEDKSLKNFISHIVVGKQFYYVDYEFGNKTITYETLNTNNVFYPNIEGIDWVQDGPWVMKVDMRSLNYLISTYSLKEEDMKKLKESTFDHPLLIDFNTSDFGKSLSSKNQLYSGTSGMEEGIPEYKIWWRSSKKIQIKKSTNPHDSTKHFTHYIDNEDKVLNNGQLYWDAKKKLYVDKDTAKEWNKKDVINVNKGEKLETRYIDEIWEGVVLGDDIIAKGCRKESRLYSNENYSYTILPIIGRSYNDLTNRPYSLVWDTKDLQKSFNLINFHRELLLATSGVKGTIMDITQKPEGMSKKEWMYYKKLGTQWIETVKKNGRISSYNQFGSYDDTVSASIQYLDNMLLMIDDMLGNIIGVPRQRQAQVSSSDQVGTYQMALEQSNLITEVIYSEHDEVERRAMEAAVNLACKYVYKDGGNLSYRTKNLSMETFNVPGKILSEIDIRIDVANNSLEERNLKELKGFAVREYDKGILPFSDFIKLYSSKTLKDLEKKFEGYVDEALNLAQQNQMARSEQELQVQTQLLKLQAELDAQLQSQTTQLKQMELQMKANLEQMKLQLEEKKLIQQDKQHGIDSQITLIQQQAENIIEAEYIAEQNRSNIVNEKLRAIEIQMKGLMDQVKSTEKSAGTGKKGFKGQHIRDH